MSKACNFQVKRNPKLKGKKSEEEQTTIDEYYQNIGKNSLPECKNELYQKFQKAYNSCPEFKKRLHEDIENMIMNGGLLD